MQFSVWPNMNHPPDEVLARARWAEANGFHGVWYADHYMPNTGSEAIEQGATYECWAMMPAIAAVTERVRVGSLVTPTSVHHPAVLANRAATIDHLSGGRMVLGLGAGWQINEHRAYGIALEPPGARVTRFEEAIQIVRSLLADERTTFRGSVYTIIDAPCDPPPLQTPLPILVGTGSPRMLRITARHADEWNTWGSPEVAAERRRGLLAACEAVGRDPGELWTSVQILLALADSDAERERALAGELGGRTLAGSAAELVDQVSRYAELGFDEFIVPDWNLGPTAAARHDALARLHADVLSQL